MTGFGPPPLPPTPLTFAFCRVCGEPVHSNYDELAACLTGRPLPVELRGRAPAPAAIVHTVPAPAAAQGALFE